MKASYVKLCELADEEVKHASTTKKSTFVGADLNLTHRANNTTSGRSTKQA